MSEQQGQGNPGSEDEEATVFHSTGSPRPEKDTAQTPIQPQGTASPDGRTGAQESDRFTLRQVLGEGSQGEVCRAFDNHLQREVAIKFPHRSSGDAEAIEILDEARKAARLNHPNAVTVYECGWWQGRPFICMELVPGISLSGLLKECGRISVDRWARYGRQILGALKAAHAVGLVHRDLKPQNVLVAPSGELKLTDFGIAHIARGPRTRNTSMNNVIAGTPMYMSPEQWNGEAPDARSDIYAFGCMSFVMLSGRGPFPCEDPMREHLEVPAPSLRERVPEIPRAIDEVVLRCLAKDPNDRFMSCDDLLFAIERALRESATATAEIDTPVESTKSGAPWMLIIGILALLGGLAFFLLGTASGRGLWSGEEPSSIEPQGPGEKASPGPKATDPKAPEGPGKEPGSDPIARRDARVQELLTLARDETLDDDDRLGAIEEIQSLIVQGPAWNEATALATKIQRAGDLKTEAQLKRKLKSVLEGARAGLADGDLDAALAGLTEAEALVDDNDVLRASRGELHRLASPLLGALGDRDAQRGAFESARLRFAEAVRRAALAPGGTPLGPFEAKARLAQRLGLCDAVLAHQPSFALGVVSSLKSETANWPAAALLRAKAQILLGRDGRARKDLATLSQRSDLAPELRTQVQQLQALIADD